MKYKDATITNVEQSIRDLLKKNVVEIPDGEGKIIKKELNRGLFLTGGTGTGKTYTLHAVRKVLNGWGSATDVENWIELLFELREKISKGYLRDTLKAITDKEYIFIDDLGAEKQTEWSQEMLYLIVNRAYEDGKKLFIATNLSIEQFTEKYGERIASRLFEMCEPKALIGEDKRI